MKRLLPIVTIFIYLLLFTASCLAASPEEGYDRFSISFEQDGRTIPVNDHVVHLKKKEFAIDITFHGYNGQGVAVRLKPSVNDVYYKQAQNGVSIAELAASGIGMAEPLKINKELAINHSNGVHYWMYSEKSGSRFHSVKVMDGQLVGKRIVSGLYVNQVHFSLENCPMNELYLVFVTARKGSVAQQEYFKIHFDTV